MLQFLQPCENAQLCKNAPMKGMCSSKFLMIALNLFCHKGVMHLFDYRGITPFPHNYFILLPVGLLECHVLQQETYQAEGR